MKMQMQIYILPAKNLYFYLYLCL